MSSAPEQARVLITGASGFAGHWPAHACAAGDDEVIGVSRRGTGAGSHASLVALDIWDRAATRELFAAARPAVVYHLAALSSVGRSWDAPAEVVSDNVASAVSVLEAIRVEAPDARLVWVSSCEVYGPAQRLPIAEDAPLLAPSPYAVSKAAGDQLAAVYADAYGLAIVRARPFSTPGLGSPTCSSSPRSPARLRARLQGARRLELVTGNPDTRATSPTSTMSSARTACSHRRRCRPRPTTSAPARRSRPPSRWRWSHRSCPTSRWCTSSIPGACAPTR